MILVARRGSLVTRRWREPDSNHRFRLRYSPSGSSLVVSADLSTLPSRKRSSQLTPRWRKQDSNRRSPSRGCRLILGEEKGPAVDQIVSKDAVLFTGDQWFESAFL